MVFSVLLGALMLGTPALVTAQAKLSTDDWAQARQVAIGESTTFASMPLGKAHSGAVRMRRIDIYAADAKILLDTGDGVRELPRTDWLHFVADATVPGAPRLGLSISADGKRATGLLLANDGGLLTIGSRRDGAELAFELRDAKTDALGNPTRFACDNHQLPWRLESQPRFAGMAEARRRWLRAPQRSRWIPTMNCCS